MKSRKNLKRAVALSLLLATVGFSTAGATITSGTYNIGGNITSDSTYVNASDNVTLNATTDVNFASGVTMPFTSAATGKTIAVNMNGNSITSNYVFTILSGSNNSLQVLNAKDITINSAGPHQVTINGKGDSIVLQANHNFSMIDNLVNSGYGQLWSKTAGKLTITAGNDFYLKSSGNTASVRNGTEASFTAGNNMTIEGTNNDGSALNIGAIVGSKLTLTSVNGSINIVSDIDNTANICADSGSTTVIHAAKDIKITGASRRGLRTNGGTMNVTSDTGSIYIATTDTKGNINAGIYSGTNSGRGSANLNSNTFVSAATAGVQANAGDVTFAKNAAITDAATGILATSTGTVTVNGDASITSTTTDINADNATVTLAKAATLSGAATAITATNGGKVSATDTASAKKITGNIASDGVGSSVDVAMGTADSYLTGTTTSTNNGALKVNLADGGIWNVTGTSSLTNLVNNSTVNMRYTGNSTNETLTAANLSGNGSYVMNTDLQASYDSKNVQSNGDKIVITTSSSGNNILDLRDASLDDKIASQGYLLLVEDQSNGSATFSGKDLAHGGIFKYKPVITTANPTDYSGFNASAKNWYLTGFERTIEVSDNTKATLGLGETRYANYFMDQDTLLKRLGELRTIKGEPEQDGIWARYRHGGLEGSGFSGGSSMVQVGYDKKTSNKRYTGFAFNHTSSSYDFDGGATGEGSQDALTVYNTWLGDKNHYFDIVGKLGKMRGDSTYEDSLFPEKGNYDSWYCSISGEYGRKNIDKNGWYYEPQAQLTLGRIRGDDYTTSLGTKVNMESITSLISRAGITFGKEYNMKDSNTHSNIYGKINWLHEFKGDANTSLRDTYGDSYDHKTENSGSWWNAGIGATINVNKNTHMYLDIEKNFGGEVTTNWIGQLGCQWTWK
jgi:outer membrane autotransporter protein